MACPATGLFLMRRPLDPLITDTAGHPAPHATAVSGHCLHSIFSLTEDSVMLQEHGLRPNTPVIFPLQTETKRPHYSFLFPYPLHLSIQYP